MPHIIVVLDTGHCIANVFLDLRVSVTIASGNSPLLYKNCRLLASPSFSMCALLPTSLLCAVCTVFHHKPLAYRAGYIKQQIGHVALTLCACQC